MTIAMIETKQGTPTKVELQISLPPTLLVMVIMGLLFLAIWVLRSPEANLLAAILFPLKVVIGACRVVFSVLTS